eukprot:TRINITY_DN9795_c0_g1_i2.p1 TRINITY_DN9795_c0_g1~~TRINITY_DN9795_c0_g1_i2.p1  ORF type:complete len:229 (+),score=48.15 TRINITY_DN9795_c0_g1_i2:80-766(+)
MLITTDSSSTTGIIRSNDTNIENHRFLYSELSQISLGHESDEKNVEQFFPPEQLDSDGQQVDLRSFTSWTQKISDVHPIEMIEVQMINNIAPFIIVSTLKPLMAPSKYSPSEFKFIINVSSAEAQFKGQSTYKDSSHPHTNMAKAAMNMMTRTIAEDLRKENIYINSVDTGWVSKMSPQGNPKYNNEKRPPLDALDGASRVLDPIITGLQTKQPICGKFFQNFESAQW